MAVVLNQVDLLSSGEAAAWKQDAQRLLGEDGLTDLPVLVVSARTGAGLDDLRQLLAERVAAREAAVARLTADVDGVAGRLAAACGSGKASGIDGADRKRLVTALEDAAGVPTVVRAVGAAHRRRGSLEAGWPFVRWIRRLRPDPLRRLRLPGDSAGRSSHLAPAAQRRPASSGGDRGAEARRSGRRRTSSSLAAARARRRRPPATRRSPTGSTAPSPEPTSTSSRPRWWRAARLLQRLLAAAVLAGVLWLLGLAVLGYLRVDDVIPVPELRDVPIPTWLLVGGALAGLALAFLARIGNGVGARRRSRAAARSLRERIEEVARAQVIDPVEAELDARARLRAAIEAAAGRRK